jgi:hypothetical protein
MLFFFIKKIIKQCCFFKPKNIVQVVRNSLIMSFNLGLVGSLKTFLTDSLPSRSFKLNHVKIVMT